MLMSIPNRGRGGLISARVVELTVVRLRIVVGMEVSFVKGKSGSSNQWVGPCKRNDTWTVLNQESKSKNQK